MDFNEIKAIAKQLGIDGWASKSVQDLSREIKVKLSVPIPVKKKAAPKKKKANPADINGDGKVDEKDLSVVHKEYAKAKPKAKKKAPAKKKK